MVNGVRFNIPAIGRHNMENALAAVAVCKELGVSVVECARALQDFQGIYRRTQVVGEKKGIIIIDDFAHNPVEVSSAIEACQMIGQRVIAWFQPHGFGPLRFFHRELVENVTGVMRSNDRFYMPDVFYAGGTVERNINSDVVIKPLQEKGINAFYIPSRKGFFTELKGIVEPGDIVLIMGARDTSLGRFAAEVLENIEE